MSTRGITLQHIGPLTLSSGEYLPFGTTPLSQWPTSGDSALTCLNSGQIQIMNASTNDYYVSWSLSLYTASIQDLPIICLEFNYPNSSRNDYLLSPIKTHLIAGASVYHIDLRSDPDILLIALKFIGPANSQYTLASHSSAMVNATLSIMGL